MFQQGNTVLFSEVKLQVPRRNFSHDYMLWHDMDDKESKYEANWKGSSQSHVLK